MHAAGIPRQTTALKECWGEDPESGHGRQRKIRRSALRVGRLSVRSEHESSRLVTFSAFCPTLPWDQSFVDRAAVGAMSVPESTLQRSSLRSSTGQSTPRRSKRRAVARICVCNRVYCRSHFGGACEQSGTAASPAELSRSRPNERDIARFEVLGLGTDRELIGNLARRLADGGPNTESLRASVRRAIAGKEQSKGGILDALRRSPLVSISNSIVQENSAARWVRDPASARHEHHWQCHEAGSITLPVRVEG